MFSYLKNECNFAAVYYKILKKTLSMIFLSLILTGAAMNLEINLPFERFGMILAEREREREKALFLKYLNTEARTRARLAEHKFGKPQNQNPVLFFEKKSSEHSSAISVLYKSGSSDRIYIKLY
jgi:hypothetical protein